MPSTWHRLQQKQRSPICSKPATSSPSRFGLVSRAPFRAGCDDFGAEQYRDPAQIKPDQKDRKRGKCPIDQLKGGELLEIKREAALDALQQKDADHGAQNGVAPIHAPCRRETVE